ncbi:hypothetical protein GIS00_12755 [Nakamurella sp. YIM 132087]|uniref:Uncharacterized protein n=1 Tax=Nakamurella alba TaxID=2665158 RepID=A0A7K1FKZ5_9ACTN|nr:hypothetical protein [Nakamurella alba]MTD14811.1 hypothetical protein [Nakamurella alba]
MIGAIAIGGAVMLAAACGSDTSGGAATTAPAVTTSAEATSGGMDTSTGMDTSMSEDTATSEDTGGSEMSNPSATTTVGGGEGLDEASAAWFTTMCEGVTPLTEMGDGMTGSDPSQVAKKIEEAGTALTQTASDLEGQPAPTFDGGEEFATKAIEGFKQLGTAFTEAADAIAKNDPAGLQKLQESLQADGPLQQLAGFDATPELKQAVAELPACKALTTMGG